MSAPYPFPEFGFVRDSRSTSRPSSSDGTSITPDENAKGAHATVLTALETEVSFVSIGFSGNIGSGNARDTLADIAIDPAGGTAWQTPVIPNLLASCAALSGNGLATSVGCVWYHFPVRLPAGASVGCRGSVNNATVGTFRCQMIVYGKPRHRFRTGSKVIAFGVTEASSSGTAVTPGTTSEGAWADLGLISRPCWWWQYGVGFNNATMANLSYFGDLGVGVDPSIVIVSQNDRIRTSNGEAVGKEGTVIGCVRTAAPGVDHVYGRMRCSGTPDTGISMAAYGVI